MAIKKISRGVPNSPNNRRVSRHPALSFRNLCLLIEIDTFLFAIRDAHPALIKRQADGHTPHRIAFYTRYLDDDYRNVIHRAAAIELDGTFEQVIGEFLRVWLIFNMGFQQGAYVQAFTRTRAGMHETIGK